MQTITVTAKSIANQLQQWRIGNQDSVDYVYRFPASESGERFHASERTADSFLRVISEMPAAAGRDRIYTDEELGYE